MWTRKRLSTVTCAVCMTTRMLVANPRICIIYTSYLYIILSSNHNQVKKEMGKNMIFFSAPTKRKGFFLCPLKRKNILTFTLSQTFTCTQHNRFRSFYCLLLLYLGSRNVLYNVFGFIPIIYERFSLRTYTNI